MNSTPCCLVAAHNVEQRMRTVREIYFIKNYELTLWKKQEENKNKLVEKVQKINEDSVDRISRMIFNCDLCLNIMNFFSMEETRGKKTKLVGKVQKIDESSVDRISRIVFSCDLCLCSNMIFGLLVCIFIRDKYFAQVFQ